MLILCLQRWTSLACEHGSWGIQCGRKEEGVLIWDLNLKGGGCSQTLPWCRVTIDNVTLWLLDGTSKLNHRVRCIPGTRRWKDATTTVAVVWIDLAHVLHQAFVPSRCKDTQSELLMLTTKCWREDSLTCFAYAEIIASSAPSITTIPYSR